MLLDQISSEVSNLSETAAAVRTILTEGAVQLPQMVDDAGHPLSPSPEQAERLAYEKLFGFVAGWLEDTHSFVLDDDEFLRHHADFWQTWASGRVTHQILVPLLFFRSETLPIELEHDTRIQQLGAAEKSSLWQHSVFDAPLISAQQLASSHAAIVGTYDTPSASISDGSAYRDLVDDVVLALRLLKRGTVFPGAIYDRVLSLQLPGVRSSGVKGHWRPVPRHPFLYVLEAHEVSAFRHLFTTIRKLRTQARGQHDLAVAFRRFDQTFTRENAEDQVIDVTIGLESTILFGAREELKHRLALRGAYLQRESIDPQISFHLLKKLYDVRSGIVHSGRSLLQMAKQNQIGNLPANEFVPSVIDWYRALLRNLITALGQGKTLGTLIGGIEAALIQLMQPGEAFYEPPFVEPPDAEQ